MTGNKIAIIGTGGMGRDVLLLLHQINEAKPTWNICGFYDDAIPASETINRFPYLGTIEDLNQVEEPLHVAIGIGDCKVKRNIRNRITNANIQFPTLVHPEIKMRDYQFNQIGEGCIITEGCILTTNIRIGNFVLLNIATNIGHDAILNDYCSLMQAVNISGNVILNDAVYIGTNATVLQQKQIGENSIIGAGAVVVSDLPANVTAAGVPAKIIKIHDPE